MTLKAARDALLIAVRANKDAEATAALAKLWFKALKEWEQADTFATALADNRMSARCCSPNKISPVAAYDVGSVKSMHNVNVGATGVLARLEPDNFLANKKHELGLHDVSAVLLDPKKVLSKQLFDLAGKLVVFMPIPLEDDLQAYAEVCAAAKADPKGPLYNFVVEARARFTRIKFGSADDMGVGYLLTKKADGAPTLKYGEASVIGTVLQPEILQLRSANALFYKSKIAGIQSREANNEVTVKYRQHAGIFPMVGVQGKNGSFVLGTAAGTEWGTLADDGTSTPKSASSSTGSSLSSAEAAKVSKSAYEAKHKGD